MSKIEENAINILESLEKAGFQAFFAGGYVRDRIMKRKIHDIDIATDAKPNEIKKVLEKKKIKYIEIGESFGVIAAIVPKNKKENFIYEIATFRQDFGVEDNRHPKGVKFLSDPREDAIRRDFTINGLFMMNQESRIKNQEWNSKIIIQDSKFKIQNFKWGKVLDFVNGIQDIKLSTIRFIGTPQERIEEDALRMMRAIRFACQLDFEIDPESLRAIEKNKNLIKEISSERIKDEISKILASKNRRKGIELLDQVGILEIVIPELKDSKTTPQPKNMHSEGSVWNHILLGLEKIRVDDDPTIGWTVLLHDVGKSYTIQTPEKDGTDRIRFSGHDSEGSKIAEKILKRLKFSNEEMSKITWVIKYHMLFGNFGQMRESTRIRYLANPYFPALLEMFWVDANSSVRSNAAGKILPPDLTGYNRAMAVFQKEKGKPKLPKPILRGDDVMKLMGVKEGSKLVGEIMREVYDAQLEKKIKNKRDAIKMAEKLLKKK